MRTTQVCIIGVGLIGGSLGMALRRIRRKGKRVYHVSAIGRSDQGLKLAKKLGAIDEGSRDLEKIIPEADIVVLATPVQFMAPLMKRVLPLLKIGAIVTDAGSVKQELVSRAADIFHFRRDVSFVGGHPLAGSEKSGVQYASPNLFKKAVCILTSDKAPKKSLRTIQTMWASVGSRCLIVKAKDHDQLLALTSHLPHLLAFALFSLVQTASKKHSLIQDVVAGSFKDMTRIAASDAALWTGIIQMNRSSLAQVKRQFETVLNQLVHTPPSHLYKRLDQLSRAKRSW